MEKIKCKAKLTYKNDYLNVDLYNSSFEDIQFEEIIVDFTLSVIEVTNGVELELDTLNKIIAQYNTIDDNIVDVLDEVKLKEFKVETEIGDDQYAKGLKLTGISLDLIKKYVILKFNDK